MIQFDINDLDKLRERLDPKKVDKAMNWTLDAVTRKARTMVSREVRKTYDIKAGDISSQVQIKRLDNNASRVLLYTGRRIPLERFKPQIKNVSVMVTHPKTGTQFKRKYQATSLKIRKDRGRRIAKGAFSHGGPVFRRAPGGRGGFDSNQAFRQFGPSIPGMVRHQTVLDQFQELIRKDAPTTFNNRLEYLLGMR